jgi:sulfatase modifying factor 1
MSWLVRAAVALGATVALAPPSLTFVPTRDRGLASPTSPDTEATAAPLAALFLRAPASLMILVPGSTFSMGSTDDDVLAALTDCQGEPGGDQCDAQLFSDETPSRAVTLSPYWLDRTEVTVEAYSRCVAVGRCAKLSYDEGATRFDRPNFPVSLVTWNEASDYCAFRGARLPTEAEYERAARGVSGRKYPWGDLYNSRAANHAKAPFSTKDEEDGYSELAPVGSFPSGRTPDGFLDLAGNVAEWVQDRYAPGYGDAGTVDPAGPGVQSASPARIVRGGGFESQGPWLRGASRQAAEPTTRRPWIGFRCARSARRY